MQTSAGKNIEHLFRFKQFSLTDASCGMKIGTDGLLIGAWSGAFIVPRRIADIGAGCGIVGLMAAQRFPDARVHFVENETGAVADLNRNIASSPWAGRCTVESCDFRDSAVADVDLIVSNPPFFTSGELAPDASRAGARHADTLSPLTLIDFAARRLAPGGVLSMIFPAEQLADVEARAAFARLNPARVCGVITRPGKQPRRVMAEFTPASVARSESILTLRNSDNTYTDDYIALTSAFHIDL